MPECCQSLTLRASDSKYSSLLKSLQVAADVEGSKFFVQTQTLKLSVESPRDRFCRLLIAILVMVNFFVLLVQFRVLCRLHITPGMTDLLLHGLEGPPLFS